MTTTSLFMTADELASEADCTPEYINELAHDGEIPGLKFGRSWRFVRASIVGDIAALARRQAAERAQRAPLVRQKFLLRRGANYARRRAAKLQRTAPWADETAIRAFYAEAQRLTRETGIQHHVDHVIPLQGRLVSGLHVHTNLQILTGSENIRKRNRFEVEP